MSGGATVVCAYSEVGHACLDTLLRIGADVRLVVTHRDAPGEKVWFGSVAERARAEGVPVIEPDDVNAPEVVEAIAATQPDLLYSFYFRQMIRPRILEIPRLGALNLHGSLLPRYRGRAPVNWVLVHGEKESGVTLHYMDAKPDHGDVVGRRAVAIERDETALSLTRKLAGTGCELLAEMHPHLLAGSAPREPQDHTGSCYFGGRTPADGEIDWSQPAEQIRNLIRAVTEPWPGAFSFLQGRKLLVWWAETRPDDGGTPGEVRIGDDGVPRVATADGALELTRYAFDDEGPTLKDGDRLG